MSEWCHSFFLKVFDEMNMIDCVHAVDIYWNNEFQTPRLAKIVFSKKVGKLKRNKRYKRRLFSQTRLTELLFLNKSSLHRCGRTSQKRNTISDNCASFGENNIWTLTMKTTLSFRENMKHQRALFRQNVCQ